MSGTTEAFSRVKPEQGGAREFVDLCKLPEVARSPESRRFLLLPTDSNPEVSKAA